jgi:Fe-S-cluster containining protein
MLAESPEDVRRIATLTRVLGIPSDHQFAAEHWRPLTREAAMAANPFYVSRVRGDVHWYACDRLGADGKCTAYDERPLVCRGYPWYGAEPTRMPLPDPECGYAVDLPRD